MEIPYAFGETCFSPRLFSFSFRETRPHGVACIKGNPSNQLRETSLASLLGKLHPPSYLTRRSSSFPSFYPFAFLTLPLPGQSFSLSIFVLSRSINSQPDTSFRLALPCYERSFRHLERRRTWWGKGSANLGALQRRTICA